MARDTLTALGRVARSPAAKALGVAILPGLVIFWGWAADLARLPDVAAAVATHDHGHAEPLPKDADGRLKPAHDHLVTRLRTAEATIRLLEQQQAQRDELQLTTIRWLVRSLAADAEPRRAHKMEAAAAAEAAFDRYTADGQTPAKAIRLALPPRYPR